MEEFTAGDGAKRMKHRKIIINVVSVMLALIAAFGTLMLNTKSSEAQQAPQVCQSRTYTCEGKGTGIDMFLADAKESATDGCGQSLRDCQRQKSTECAQFCMRQNCIPATQITGGKCSDPECASGTIHNHRRRHQRPWIYL